MVLQNIHVSNATKSHQDNRHFVLFINRFAITGK